MARIGIYDATDLDKQQIERGLDVGEHDVVFFSEPISTKTIDPECEVISVFVSSAVTADIIEALPKLKLIACRSTGFNHIDLSAAEKHGVTVVNVPTYGESTVAEYAFMLLMALTRKLPQSIESFDKEIKASKLMGTDLSGKCLGVIGVGHIGEHAIKIAKGFQMEVIAYDPSPKPELEKSLGFRFVSLDELLSHSDFVTLHAPYVGTNKHLINAENIGLLRKSAIIVNTARGELIDTKALAEALQDGRIAGAALDVLEGEQLLHVDEEIMLLRSDKQSLDLMKDGLALLALHKMPNVIITPHNAFNSVEAVRRINATTAENIVQFWQGDTPNKVEAPEKAPGKLLLVRHAESEWNATGKWTGTTNVNLSEKGFKEAGMLGVAIRDMDIHIDHAFYSEQVRTLETLSGILDVSQQPDVPITRSAAINERDYGEYTGKNKWDIQKLLGEDAFNAIRRGWDEPIPGGETLKAVYERVVPFYQQEILPLINDGKNVLVVAHGNSIRALIKYIERLNEQQVSELEMLFGTVVLYDLDHKGFARARRDVAIDSPPPNA